MWFAVSVCVCVRVLIVSLLLLCNCFKFEQSFVCAIEMQQILVKLYSLVLVLV